MDDSVNTRYPILLVHGLFGFDRIGSHHYFHGIKQALNECGASVFVPIISAANDNEARGDQLLKQIHNLRRQIGAQRVNLIGHSQGALTARYVAAIAPELIASVTSVSGPNHGSELADRLRLAFVPGRLGETVAAALTTSFSAFVSALSGHPHLPQNALNALNALTTDGVAAFNRQYPQGLPDTWGGQGAAQVNGVRYYSWSGTLQPGKTDRGRNLFDGTHRSCRLFARSFVREKGQCDGMVGRCSSHLGVVIGDDYALDHFDIVNQSLGLVGKGAEPIRLFVEHARRLKAAGV